MLAPEHGKGPRERPFHEFGPVERTRAVFTTVRRKAKVQAEGCPDTTDTIPLPVTQTEISLDIGSPSFHYVEHARNVGEHLELFKARYMNRSAISLPEHLDTQLADIAAASGRSREDIVVDALETYVLARKTWHAHMDRAMGDAASGAGYSGEDVLQWMESWGDAVEKAEPKPLTSI